MPTDPVRRLRTIGLAEATSFLLLLGVAMPLKYLMDMPLAVRVVGWVHGLLFIVFCLALLQAHRHARWSLARSFIVLVAGLVPFGPFFVDRKLKSEEEAA